MAEAAPHTPPRPDRPSFFCPKGGRPTLWRESRSPRSSLPGVRDVSSLNADASLADLGLDSLMGVEVRQTLERDYDIVMAMRDIRQVTINKLRELASSKPGGPDGTIPPGLPAGSRSSNGPNDILLFVSRRSKCSGEGERRPLVAGV